jgi:NADH dehydrogenase
MAGYGIMAGQAPHEVLIVGGGFAGLACARRLANDHRFAVTLVDRTNHHLFQPLLYQVATASLAAPDIEHAFGHSRVPFDGAAMMTTSCP